MTINIFVLYLLIGGVELFVLYKKEGKSKAVGLYLLIYSIAMLLGLLTLLDVMKRNFSYIMDFWY